MCSSAELRASPAESLYVTVCRWVVAPHVPCVGNRDAAGQGTRRRVSGVWGKCCRALPFLEPLYSLCCCLASSVMHLLVRVPAFAAVLDRHVVLRGTAWFKGRVYVVPAAPR
jgi:hypothetical protein